MFDLQCVKDFIAAAQARDVGAALEHGGHLLDMASKLWKAFAEGKVFAASPEQAAEVAKMVAELEALAAEPTLFTGPVGKLGDGVFLKQLIELAIKLLPLFL